MYLCTYAQVCNCTHTYVGLYVYVCMCTSSRACLMSTRLSLATCCTEQEYNNNKNNTVVLIRTYVCMYVN